MISGLLLLLVVGVLIYLIFFQTPPARNVVTLTADGKVERAPIRINLADGRYNEHHKTMKTGLDAKLVRKASTHVAFAYKEDTHLLLNGQPAMLLGFKDKLTYGLNHSEYGHIVTKDGRTILAFEALAPSKETADRHHGLLTQYKFTGLRGLHGSGIATLEYTATPIGKYKEVKLRGSVRLR